MKNGIPVVLGLLLILSAGLSLYYLNSRSWVVDTRVATGEWRIEIQTPPCDNVHNLQVIWPKESGNPMTVECDSMPVKESK